MESKMISSLRKELKPLDKQLKTVEKQLKAAKEELNHADLPEPALKRAKAALKTLEDRYKDLRILQSKSKEMLRTSNKLLSNQRKVYRIVKAQCKQAEKQLKRETKKLKAGEKELKEAQNELREKAKELEAKKLELAEKKRELEDKEKELAKGKQDYRKKKAETERKLADAQQKIDHLDEPACVFVTRSELDSFAMFRDNDKSMVQLPLLFVIQFSLIGLVVMFSTITILIDNEKKYIGTMKAFGFRSGEISGEFVIFSASAIALGIVLSVLLSVVLQRIFCDVLGPMFCVKPDKFFLRWEMVLLFFLLEELLCVAVSVLVTALSANRHSAVNLMQGTADSARCSRSFGGRFGTLYSRLILRNIVSDLPRVVVTTVIISGCCLIMGAGFTMNHAFMDMMPSSAREVNRYDLELSLTAQKEDGDFEAMKQYLREQNVDFALYYFIERYWLFCSDSGTAKFESP